MYSCCVSNDDPWNAGKTVAALHSFTVIPELHWCLCAAERPECAWAQCVKRCLYLLVQRHSAAAPGGASCDQGHCISRSAINVRLNDWNTEANIHCKNTLDDLSASSWACTVFSSFRLAKKWKMWDSDDMICAGVWILIHCGWYLSYFVGQLGGLVTAAYVMSPLRLHGGGFNFLYLADNGERKSLSCRSCQYWLCLATHHRQMYFLLSILACYVLVLMW